MSVETDRRLSPLPVSLTPGTNYRRLDQTDGSWVRDTKVRRRQTQRVSDGASFFSSLRGLGSLTGAKVRGRRLGSLMVRGNGSGEGFVLVFLRDERGLDFLRLVGLSL